MVAKSKQERGHELGVKNIIKKINSKRICPTPNFLKC
jgi:hypothetical protein